MVHPRVFEVFEGVDQIWHAGDIGGENVITELAAIAPVIAVHGNSDSFPVVSRYKAEVIIPVRTLKFLLIHKFLSHKLDRFCRTNWEEDSAYDAIIFGHTHQPIIHHANDVLYFNPGSSQFPRFHHPQTVGLLRIHDDNTLHPKIISLSNTEKVNK